MRRFRELRIQEFGQYREGKVDFTPFHFHQFILGTFFGEWGVGGGCEGRESYTYMITVRITLRWLSPHLMNDMSDD